MVNDNDFYTPKEVDEMYRKSMKQEKTLEQQYAFLQERYITVLELYLKLLKKEKSKK